MSHLVHSESEDVEERERERLRTPVCPSCGLSITQEEEVKTERDYRPKGRWDLTYRKDLRAFHLPRSPMEESEMARLRPWPGSGFKEEPRSSQLWTSRL